jgi:hypothetical protein
MYQLYRGDAVMTTGEEADGWIEVAVGGDAVWVKAEYLAVKPPEDPKEATITGNGRVALRKAPGGKLIRWLQPGEQITVSAIIAVEGQNWAKTPDGYVMEEYVGLMK